MRLRVRKLRSESAPRTVPANGIWRDVRQGAAYLMIKHCFFAMRSCSDYQSPFRKLNAKAPGARSRIMPRLKGRLDNVLRSDSGLRLTQAKLWSHCPDQAQYKSVEMGYTRMLSGNGSASGSPSEFMVRAYAASHNQHRDS